MSLSLCVTFLSEPFGFLVSLPEWILQQMNWSKKKKKEKKIQPSSAKLRRLRNIDALSPETLFKDQLRVLFISPVFKLCRGDVGHPDRHCVLSGWTPPAAPQCRLVRIKKNEAIDKQMGKKKTSSVSFYLQAACVFCFFGIARHFKVGIANSGKVKYVSTPTTLHPEIAHVPSAPSLGNTPTFLLPVPTFVGSVGPGSSFDVP